MGKTLDQFLYYEEKDPDLRIYCGDSLEILPLLPSESMDMVWTDPPYGHKNHDGDLNSQLNKHRGIKDQPIENDDEESFKRVFDVVLKEVARILDKDCCCCCGGGGGPKPTFAWVANRMDSDGLEFFHSVIWNKVNPGLGWRFRRQHEMVMVAKRKSGKLLWNDDAFATANIISIYPDRERFHPNEKPLGLPLKFIQWHGGQNVLDPFLGSGTTLVACKELNRSGIGIEISEKYCEIAKKRLKATCKSLFAVNGAGKSAKESDSQNATLFDVA